MPVRPISRSFFLLSFMSIQQVCSGRGVLVLDILVEFYSTNVVHTGSKTKKSRWTITFIECMIGIRECTICVCTIDFLKFS